MHTMTEHERIAVILGGRSVLKAPIHTLMDLDTQIQQGFPRAALWHLIQGLQVRQEILLKPLGISKATLARYKKEESGRLSGQVSDRLYRIASVLARAEHVLGDRENASGWLVEGIPALRGATPLSRLNTETGYQEVMDVLGRIEYGVYS